MKRTRFAACLLPLLVNCAAARAQSSTPSTSAPLPNSSITGLPCDPADLRNGACMDQKPVDAIPDDVPAAAPFHDGHIHAAIDGSGGIDLEAKRPRNWSYSIGSMGAYDTAFLSQKGLHATSYGGQSAAAIVLDGQRAHLLMQYGFGAVNYRHDGDNLFAQLSRLSLSTLVHLNNRWNFSANGLGTYGSDSLRAIAPIQQTPLGGIVVPNPDTSSYGVQTGNVVSTSADVELSRQSSARDGWQFSGSNSYIRWVSLHDYQISSIGRASYLHLLTRDLTIGTYAVGTTQQGNIACNSAGLGFQFLWNPKPRLTFNGSGGPTVNNSSCGQRYAYLSTGTASVRLTDNTVAYASYSRRPNDGTIPSVVWLTSVGGGVTHSFSNRIQATVESQSNVASSTASQSNYNEVYVGGNTRFFFTSHLTQEFSVRRFSSSGLGIAPQRFVAQTTLWWTSQPRERKTTLRRR